MFGEVTRSDRICWRDHSVLRDILSVLPLRLLICIAVFTFAALGVGLSADVRPPGPMAPMTTRQHLRTAAWWPTKPATPEHKFVGSATCAECHSAIAAEQATSQMARTLVRAGDSTTLHQHLDRQFHAGSYRWFLEQSGKDLSVHVTDGTATRSAPLEWAFGSGDVGQSYMWQAGGAFHEARFNFFATTGGFDATPGRLHGAPTSVDMALGRPMENFEARTCFACHTTTMSAAATPDTASVVPGVGCEACHGPGAAHVQAVEAHQDATAQAKARLSAVALQPPPQAGAPTGGATRSSPKPPEAVWDRRIVNPARMKPAEAVDLCGSCHSTAWDVRVMGAVGVQTVRFPAYRLEQSRCWGTSGDARITCFACHDPHAPLARQAAAYDSACLQCHANRDGTGASTAGTAGRPGDMASPMLRPIGSTPAAPGSQHPGPACPVATSKCVTCHMPKIELPEMHYKFTDHRIRVAHNDAPFPD